MKQRIYLVIVFAIVITLSVSCKKKSETKSHLLQAKVNDTLIVCEGKVREDLGGNYWGIEGSDGNGNKFTITCPVTKGTYQFLSMYSGTMSEAFFTRNANYNHQYHSSNGSIKITENSGENIKGSFSFKGIPFDSSDVAEVTEGTFDIDF